MYDILERGAVRTRRPKLPGPTPALPYRTCTPQKRGPQVGRSRSCLLPHTHTALRMRNTTVVKGWSVGSPLSGGSRRLRWRLLGTDTQRTTRRPFCSENVSHALRCLCEGIGLLSPCCQCALAPVTAQPPCVTVLAWLELRTQVSMHT